MQLCPPACPSQNMVANVCLILVSPLQIQRQILKILKDAGVWVKAGKWYLGWQWTGGCYRDPRRGFNTHENGGDKIHSIQTVVLNLGSSCPSLALSESQNSFGITEHSELEVPWRGADWKGKKTLIPKPA